jgi:signal transduction histidine kinase
MAISDEGGETAPGTAPPKRWTWRVTGSLRGRLTLLVAVLVLAASMATLLLMLDAVRSHRVTTERQLYGTARALSLATDGEVGKLEAVLRVLATSPELQAGNLAAFERQARAANLGPSAWIALTDATGQQRIITRLPPGAPLPRGPSPTFAARWQTLLETGRQVSNLTQSQIYPGPVLVVDILVRKDGKPAYDLMAVTTPQMFQAVIDKQALPKGWYGGLLDRDGLIIARNIDPAHTVGTPATKDMRARLMASNHGVFPSVSRDGHETLAAFHRSDFTGWTNSVAMPRAEGIGYANRTLLQTLAAAGALLMIGAAIAFLLARGATDAMGRLEAAAAAMGRGEKVTFAPAGVDEIDAVAVALARAADDLRAREEEATEKLVQAQKLEAMGRLTGGVAHDFNNLLTAILGNLSLLTRRLNDPDLSQYASNAAEAAHKGARLTSQLLAFARKQRLTPEPVDVNAVITGMADLIAGAVGGRVAVKTKLAPLAGLAMADRTQLELMILNLAINARDAMPDGGALTVETGRRTLTGVARAAEDPQPGDYVMISVTDTGEGMTNEVRDKVFEPFFTTKDVGRGSGLGMSQILGVAKQLGGGVGIETSPGKGSTIRIYMPPATGVAARAAPGAGAGAGGGMKPNRLAGRRVLLVDDDESVRDIAAGLLADAGMTPIPAVSGADALAQLEAGAQPDLALLDFAMPGLNGAETAIRILALRPGLPVVIMSGYMDVDGLGQRWAGPLITKPFTAEVLTDELTRALEA